MGGDHWEHFQHEADVGLRGYGSSPAAAFAQAALALTAVVTSPETVSGRDAVAVRCNAPDRGMLLVDWLNALVYEMATRRMLFSHYEVDIDGLQLKAIAWGEPVDPGRHQPVVEVKGATYTELEVRELPEGGWLAQCVVDV